MYENWSPVLVFEPRPALRRRTNRRSVPAGTPRSALLTIYNAEGDEQLVVTVGEDVLLFYRVSEDAASVAFGANIADGEYVEGRPTSPVK